MTEDEYNKLFHKLQLNRVAFKRLMDCDEEVLSLVNFAVAAEREACAKEAELCIKTEPKVSIRAANAIAAAIRSRT